MIKGRIKSFDEGVEYLNSFIRASAGRVYTGDWGLQRTKELLKALDNPQEKIRVVHIAGTSGKGSAAYLTSKLLAGLGYKTGLHLSPHLLDVRERCQINNGLISGGKFVGYLNNVIEMTGLLSGADGDKRSEPTYFELLVALAYYIFWREKVDFGVIETGLGGLYDGTNVVGREDKVCVITRIGKDHTKILGNTFEKIAKQKAGIIQKGNKVVILRQNRRINKVFSETAESRGAGLYWVRGNEVMDIEGVELGMKGEFQVENASLALKAVVVATDNGRVRKMRNFEKEARRVLNKAGFRGRFEVFRKGGKTVILDGAHNPQKMRAFTSSLRNEFSNNKFIFLVAFKKGKDIKSMLEMIVPLAEKIYIGSFFTKNQDMPHLSIKAEAVGKELERIGYKEYIICGESSKAFKQAMGAAEDILVVTGSLYFIGEIYGEVRNG